MNEASKLTTSVPFGGKQISITIYRTTISDQEWIFFEAKGFFHLDGGTGAIANAKASDPYIHSGEITSKERDGEQSLLLRDSLFACRAVPEILRALDLDQQNLVIHAQDWQFASTALTIKEALVRDELTRASIVLTLHNPFDHFLPTKALELITNRLAPKYWPTIDGEARETTLTRMLPLMDAPISVVSHGFASEFSSAPLLKSHFAPHYQHILSRQGLVAIDNGPFDQIDKHPFSSSARSACKMGAANQILREKLVLRRTMLNMLEDYQKQFGATCFGQLFGQKRESISSLPNEIPIFIMTGRLDPGQKGFDILSRAIESIPVDSARYILASITTLGHDRDMRTFIDDLQDLAERRRGEILIIPKRMEAGYQELLAGATFGIWPSLYEPFGGVSEQYIAGTPVIARMTGGLKQQVIDLALDRQHGTGIGFLETLSIDRGNAEPNTNYRNFAEKQNPDERAEDPLYRTIVSSLEVAIMRAIDLYQRQPDLYGQLLANLHDQVATLGWDKPVSDYRKWYTAASTE